MLVFKTQKTLKDFINKAKSTGKQIGFVPTMGALHNGHLSLIKASLEANDISLCSIFVNPTQFNDSNDLKNYPQPLEKDLALLESLGCQAVFTPDMDEIYPKEDLVIPNYDLGILDTILEAAHRPGHFQGVAHIMTLLLNLVEPHHLYMGQKDFQQCMVIKHLLKQMDSDTHFNMMPILREDDGLAMSSRNQRLNEFERAKAGLLYQVLVSIKAKQGMQDFSIIQKENIELLEHKGLKVDYLSLVDAETLETYDNFKEDRPLAVVIAAHLGNVRLIDNILL